MGFSVSGATAIILVGGLVAFSFAFTAANNGFERISDAQQDREDRLLDTQNTEIELASATYDGGAGEVEVVVNNTGSTDLDVNGTSLLVDGEYRPDARTSVEGDDATELWLPGEQLTLTADATTQPDSVKVVTPIGVADTETEVVQSG